MGRIARLPEHVANQIAAGEVVERPASVVKELLENAIDAEARRVTIEVEDGGTALIAVTDDGVGMSRADAELCLERHATSKIRDIEDLDRVGTLGFRGEALPSIASVSRFSLITRPHDEDEGTRVTAEGGARVTAAAAGAAPGTRIEVRDLFFNVPARKKFLKRAATEHGHIADVVERVALANPEVAIRLLQDGRSALDAPPATAGDPKARIGRILGRKLAEKLHALAPIALGPFRVSGWIAEPSLSERTARGIRSFVNRRFVRDRTIQHAAQDGYRTMMERGRYPVVLLWIDVEPEELDVNVHPQKIEVRFRDPSNLHRAVSRAVNGTLARQPWVAPLGYAQPLPPTRSFVLHEGREERAPPSPERLGVRRDPIIGPGASPWRPEAAPALTGGWSFTPAAAPAGRFGGLEPIGQALGTYLVCQGPGRLVLIDQHAAHERVAFERMRTQRARGRVEVQPLLVPKTLELDRAEAQLAEGARDRLLDAGFEIEPFGGRTWVIKSAPAVLGRADPERVVRDLLAELGELDASSSVDEAVEAMLSCAACHTVVRAGDRLSREEIRALLAQMDEVDFGAHCPHGRPVFIEWTNSELEKLFHRG